MDHRERTFHVWIRIVLGAIVFTLLLLCALLFRQYENLQQAQFGGMPLRGFLLHHPHAVTPSTEVTLIQPWMTFDYINHLYALPGSYLKTTLDIRDAVYPFASITETAEEQGTSTAALTDQVKSAVHDYLLTNGR